MADLDNIIDRLEVGQRQLSQRNQRETAVILSAHAERWLTTASPWMERAIEAVTGESAFSEPMVRSMLPTMIEPLAANGIQDLIANEIGNWHELARRRPPSLILHILPSNLPGHAAIPSALSLLIGSAALVKPGRNDRAFTDLWIESLVETDEVLGNALAAVYWQGGDQEQQRVALERAELVVASGGDRTIEELRENAPDRFIGHGHRISFAMVPTGGATATAARQLAQDLATWDQLGCLSPQICFVEDQTTASSFARMVADALTDLATELPPAYLSDGDVVAIRRFRDGGAWSEGRSLFEVGEPGQGSVLVEDRIVFEPSPLHRCLRVVPAERNQVAQLLASHQSVLEAAGVAECSAANETRTMLIEAGVPHVVDLGTMQRPSLAWRQGGRPRIAEWFDPQA